MTKDELIEQLLPFTEDIRVMVLEPDGHPHDVVFSYQWVDDYGAVVLVPLARPRE